MMRATSGLYALGLMAASPAWAAGVPPNPLTNPAFFPISVWWQSANMTGHSGPYPTLAAAAAAGGINIMLGQGSNWPETYGADQGEFEAIAQNKLYLIGGIEVPWNENTTNTSVASILALARALGADNNLIGYNAGDEPQCQPGAGQIGMSQVPQIIGGIHSYDPSRIVTLNETAWMLQPQWQSHPAQCLSWDIAALQATSVASMDDYPVTSPYIATQLGVGGTDYKAVPNDSLWVQGLAVQALKHFAKPGQLVWPYIESGSDNFGLSEANDGFSATVAAGSSVITSAGPQRFTSSWIGLAVSGNGLAGGTTIVGVIDSGHAELSRPATGSGTGNVSVGSGPTADCVASVNLCVVNGNEYRPTPAQVGAEIWSSVISGATGIEYFCHDHTSYSFCLDDSGAGGAPATLAFQNITYIDHVLQSYASVLNDATLGGCSMDSLNYTTGAVSTGTSCSGGGLSLATGNAPVPGAALLKSHGGALYVIAQSMRRGHGGATFSFTVPAAAGKHGTIVYDSNHQYDKAHSTQGNAITIGAGGKFSDAIGTYDDYETKIYMIQ